MPPPETITCIHCHQKTPWRQTIPFRPPLVLYVVLWRTKNGSMHARKPVVLTQDEIAARKEYERLKRERTGRGAIPVLVRYVMTDAGIVRDGGVA